MYWNSLCIVNSLLSNFFATSCKGKRYWKSFTWLLFFLVFFFFWSGEGRRRQNHFFIGLFSFICCFFEQVIIFEAFSINSLILILNRFILIYYVSRHSFRPLQLNESTVYNLYSRTQIRLTGYNFETIFGTALNKFYSVPSPPLRNII